MTAREGGRGTAATAEGRRLLDGALAGGGDPDPALLAGLARVPTEALDDAFKGFIDEHGAAALGLLRQLGSDRAERGVRRAAKRALYRLAQRGVSAPAAPASRPIVTRPSERAVRAWLSAVDGSGSRASWIVFDRGAGGLELCSLILSDTIGIVEAAGGEITKKRLATELEALRRDQKLPWVETEPERAGGLVAEALALHRALGTTPPVAFDRWRPRFEAMSPLPPPAAPAAPDPALVDRGAELLELPEMAGWFLDPEAVGGDAVELLQMRESRLVVSDQIKAEREEAVATRVVERDLDPATRAVWVRRLLEMARVFRSLGRAADADLADAAAGGLADPARDPAQQPFARALGRRALEIAGEVALGRLSAADVSRKPGPVTRA
jgi:hypothetical protein